MNTQLRKTWRKNWLSSIYEFTNLEFQKNLWIEGSYKNMIGSFTECICQYVDDLVLTDGYEYAIRQNLVSDSEADVLKNFHTLVMKYDPQNRTDFEILSDLDWQNIVNEAKTSWNKLKEIIKDEDELNYMGELEDKFGHINKTT